MRRHRAERPRHVLPSLVLAGCLSLSACSAFTTPKPVCDEGTEKCTREIAADQAELRDLLRQAEDAQHAAFAERGRLTSLGRALEPTPELELHASGTYLELAMAGLREQYRDGFRVEGSPATMVTSAPGESRHGSDPRLTMDVCEDNVAATFSNGGRLFHGIPYQGKVFAAIVDGRVKLVDATMQAVESCA